MALWREIPRRRFGYGLIVSLLAVSLAIPTTAVIAAQADTTTALNVPDTVYTYTDVAVVAHTEPAPDQGNVDFRITTPQGNSYVAATLPVGPDGVTEWDTFFNFTGVYDVQALYRGSAGYAPSDSPSTPVTIAKQPLSLVLDLDHDSIVAGQDLVLAATVSPPPDESPFGPNQVRFAFTSYGGGASYTAYAYPDPLTGVATVTVLSTDLVPELWQVTATYGPSPKYRGAQDTATLRFEPVPPLMDLTVDPDPAYPNDPLTIVATLNPPPDGGTVELFAIGPVGTQPQSLGMEPVAEDGTATFHMSFDQNDGLQLKAFYSGTDTTPPSQSRGFDRHQLYPPQTMLTLEPNSAESSPYATFAFTASSSNQLAVHFDCALDGGDWYPCTSPTTVGLLTDGQHVFQVRATDANGRVEVNPAERAWRVDTTGPSFTFTINRGAAVTSDPVVELDIDASDPSRVDAIRAADWDQLDEDGLLDSNGESQFKTPWHVDLTRAQYGGTLEDGPKTVYVQLGDGLGNWSAIQSQTILLDRAPPSETAPDAAIEVGAMATTIPVALDWPDPADNLSGISGRAFGKAVNARHWVTLSPDPSAGPATDSLVKGNVYRYRQRATDGAGNVGKWIKSVSYRAQVRQEKASAVKRQGSWSTRSVAGALGGRVLRTRAAGASVSTTFTGYSIGWVSTTGPTRGTAQVYVDGQLAATIDLWSATAHARQIVWSRTFAVAGTHTVRIVATGNGGSVDLDAFVLLGAAT